MSYRNILFYHKRYIDMGLFVYKKQWKSPAVGNKYYVLIQHSNTRKSFGSYFSFKAEGTFSSVSKRPFKTFWTFLNIILNKPYHLWMSRMDLIKTKKVPCLHVSRCWISFLKCQHNLEGAEKKEARKKTHTHKQKMWFMRKKKDDFPVTQ